MRVKITAIKNKKGFFKVLPYKSIDSDTHDDFREKIKPLLVKSTKHIVLDLEKTDYISSAGLGVIFLIKKTLATSGGRLIIYHPKPHIHRLFEAVKHMLKDTLYHSIEEADAYLDQVMKTELTKQSRSTSKKK